MVYFAKETVVPVPVPPNHNWTGSILYQNKQSGSQNLWPNLSSLCPVTVVMRHWVLWKQSLLCQRLSYTYSRTVSSYHRYFTLSCWCTLSVFVLSLVDNIVFARCGLLYLHSAFAICFPLWRFVCLFETLFMGRLPMYHAGWSNGGIEWTQREKRRSGL